MGYSLWSCMESEAYTAGSLSTPSAHPRPTAAWLSVLSTEGAHALPGAETLMPISSSVLSVGSSPSPQATLSGCIFSVSIKYLMKTTGYFLTFAHLEY